MVPVRVQYSYHMHREPLLPVRLAMCTRTVIYGRSVGDLSKGMHRRIVDPVAIFYSF